MSFALELSEQNFEVNCDFYLMNVTQNESSDKGDLFLDALSEFEGINLYPSFNLLEDDLVVKNSKTFTKDLLENKEYDWDKQIKLKKADNKNEKEISYMCPSFNKIFTIQKIKEGKSSCLSSDTETQKYENVAISNNGKDGDGSKSSNKLHESNNYSITNSVTSADIKRRFGRIQDKGKFITHTQF